MRDYANARTMLAFSIGGGIVAGAYVLASIAGVYAVSGAALVYMLLQGYHDGRFSKLASGLMAVTLFVSAVRHAASIDALASVQMGLLGVVGIVLLVALVRDR